MKRTYENARQAVQAEASEWLLRLDDETLDRHARGELLAWLKTSPQHIDEFLLASAVWRELDHLDADKRIDVDALVAEASDNVVVLLGEDAQAMLPPRRKQRHWIAGIAATIVAAIGIATFVAIHDPARHYETGVGQQTLFTLDDGSIVHLNTQSSLTVRITDNARELELSRGEAMFEVAKDPNRPFRVRSGSVLVEAIGTQFNVYRRDDGVHVTVVEGEVKVQSTTGSEILQPALAEVTLTAGEEAHGDRSGSVARIDAPDMEKSTAWREQRLVFRQDTLSTVAAEFNRYNREQIIVDALPSETRPLTATFDAHDPESFITFLERDPNIRLIRSEGTIRINVADD